MAQARGDRRTMTLVSLVKRVLKTEIFCSSFLKTHKGHREHHLYLWHLADTTGILSTVLNMLSAAVSTECGNVISTTASKRRACDLLSEAELASERKQELRRRQLFRLGFNSSVRTLAMSAKEDHLLKLQERLFTLELAAVDSENCYNARKRMCYDAYIAAMKKSIAECQADFESFTPILERVLCFTEKKISEVFAAPEISLSLL